MRRCELIALALAAAGCNPVLGIEQTLAADAAPTSDSPPPDPDLDRDGTLDADDPCIASVLDSLTDSDGDSLDNPVDDCPFDASELPDADGDGLQDACDPFPAAGGDATRCVMAMRNPGLNARLWRMRAGDMGWIFSSPGLAASGDGTIVATAEIDAPVSTSFDIYASLGASASGLQTFTLWLRTGITASPTDVGCQLRGDGIGSVLSIVHAGAPITTPIARTFAGVIRLRATLEPGGTGTNVRCELAYTAFMPLAVPALTAAITLPSGRIGFQVENAKVGIYGIVIADRATPAL